jgi:hypothetical protein
MHSKKPENSSTALRGVVISMAASNLERSLRPVPGQTLESVVIQQKISEEDPPPSYYEAILNPPQLETSPPPPPSYYEVILNPPQLEASQVCPQKSEPMFAQNPTRTQPNAL